MAADYVSGRRRRRHPVRNERNGSRRRRRRRRRRHGNERIERDVHVGAPGLSRQRPGR